MAQTEYIKVLFKKHLQTFLKHLKLYLSEIRENTYAFYELIAQMINSSKLGTIVFLFKLFLNVNNIFFFQFHFCIPLTSWLTSHLHSIIFCIWLPSFFSAIFYTTLSLFFILHAIYYYTDL